MVEGARWQMRRARTDGADVVSGQAGLTTESTTYVQDANVLAQALARLPSRRKSHETTHGRFRWPGNVKSIAYSTVMRRGISLLVSQ
jgi:hypothetical protein